MIPQIIQHPNPMLRARCEPVTDFGDDLKELCTRMELALSAAKVAALGLAANQIGVSRRVILISVIEGARLFLVNPVILTRAGEQRINDGCLSVSHGKRFLTRTRPARVYVEYQNEQGTGFGRNFKGLAAAVIDHEVDHLNGVLFLDVPARAA